MTEKQRRAREPRETGMTKEYDLSGPEGVFGGVDDEDEPKDSKQINP